MGLLLPMPSGPSSVIENALDEIIAPIQAWAGKLDAFGKWFDVPYQTQRYSCSAGAWTIDRGDAQVFQYSVIQDVMLVRVILFHTTTASIGNQLFVQLPDGWKCRHNRYIGVVEWDDDCALARTGSGRFRDARCRRQAAQHRAGRAADVDELAECFGYLQSAVQPDDSRDAGMNSMNNRIDAEALPTGSRS